MQVRQVPAVSLVGVQMAPVPDATYLQRLATAARKVLASASPAGADFICKACGFLLNQGSF